jgi:2-C-methyl-D-erythritol 4-phosphate cytidylyltransferase
MGGRRKQYLELAGQPVLLRAVLPFLEHPAVVSVVVALPPGDAERPPEWLTEASARVRVVPGGGSRRDSVLAAVEAVSPEVDVVLVHDGARPLVTRDVIDRCVREAARGWGAVAGWPAEDTVKEVDETRRIVRTPDRAFLWRAQTPQAFPRGMLLNAYRRAADEEMEATDDAALVEWAGGKVVMVRGSRTNLKITRPEDLAWAELLLSAGGARPPGDAPSTEGGEEE